MPSSLDPRNWHLDIDRLLNPFVPRPPWNRIPYPIAHFLGHRTSKPHDIGTVVPIFWAFVGVFCALSIIEVVSERIPSFRDHGAPVVVASFGAGAVLEFYAIDSPLAQPRNFLGGQILAATLGVSICKLFQLSPHFSEIRWLAGAMSCAFVVSVMAFTKTVHPPAGATALIAVVDDQIRHLGWFFIPVVMFNCTIMLAIALLMNNIQRTYPAYWWTPESLGPKKTEVKRLSVPVPLDVEGKDNAPVPQEGMRTDNSSETMQNEIKIIIRPGEVILPEHIYLMQEELQLLEEISNRL